MALAEGRSKNIIKLCKPNMIQEKKTRAQNGECYNMIYNKEYAHSLLATEKSFILMHSFVHLRNTPDKCGRPRF